MADRWESSSDHALLRSTLFYLGPRSSHAHIQQDAWGCAYIYERAPNHMIKWFIKQKSLLNWGGLCQSPWTPVCGNSPSLGAAHPRQLRRVVKAWLVFGKWFEIYGRRLSDEGKILQIMSVRLYLWIGSGIPWRWKVLHKCEILIISCSITHAKVRQTYYLINFCAA